MYLLLHEIPSSKYDLACPYLPQAQFQTLQPTTHHIYNGDRCHMDVTYEVKNPTITSPLNGRQRHIIIKTLNPTRNKNDLRVIIEGLDQIPHLMKYVPPGWRLSHCEHQSRMNFIKEVASHVVAQPEGGTLQHTWLIRIAKTISPVETCDDSCHQ